ncbi:hypothetical protein JHK84_045201 [Glycine max]|nr:hypothetical protein JHK86_045143 [Glycine max]KAG5108294.1 hypothetical protein JHK84_045201 [Glycine max]
MLGCSEIVGKLKKFSCLIGVSCRNDDITASVAEFDAWPFEEEHRRIIENRKSGTNLTWSEVNNMPYTAKVISETLRRATILPCFSRKASQDFEINGYKVRKGWSINLDVVSIHHDPEPLRPFSFLGFGSGPRMCPRMNLAKLEICVFIYHLINKYTLLIMESTSSGRQIMLGLDDPVMWGFKGFPIFDTKLARWVLAAEDICFKNALYSYIFRVGKCIPITRGGGIYQEHMIEALERLKDGEWLHTFPEGKVYQEDVPIRRLKWGTASLIVRAPITPIVLPIVHHGFHEVMPEKYMFGRRPPVPLWNKKIDIIIGDPIEFDLPAMRQKAISQSRNESFPTIGWPSTPDGLDELAQRCLYTAISEQIRAAMERLRCFGKSFVKSWVGSNLPKSEIKVF